MPVFGKPARRRLDMTLSFLCLILAYLIAERILHGRRLKRIPLRIHVNGTRGKSNVTRLIAAALRRSGVRTLAKTTGTLPKLILPDGSEEIIRRRSPANILEQMAVVKRAERLKVQALVVECMALEPTLQFISETAMIRSTLGVITNVRPDHHEVMGKSLDDVAEALSQSIPEGGILVTGDRLYYPFFSDVAAARGTRVVLAGNPGPVDGECARQDIHLFRENIEIVKSVCTLLDMDLSVVSEDLDEAAIVGEGAGVFRIRIGARTVCFVDAFAANDVYSTGVIQERAFAQGACPRPFVALFNNRLDRPLRMKSFADTLLAGTLYDYIAVTGEGCRLAQRYLRRKNPGRQIVDLPNLPPKELLEGLLEGIGCTVECTIVGMGNEKGPGRRLSRFIREKDVQ
jgi:gamma-polyglutamate synthase